MAADGDLLDATTVCNYGIFIWQGVGNGLAPNIRRTERATLSHQVLGSSRRYLIKDLEIFEVRGNIRGKVKT